MTVRASLRDQQTILVEINHTVLHSPSWGEGVFRIHPVSESMPGQPVSQLTDLPCNRHTTDYAQRNQRITAVCKHSHHTLGVHVHVYKTAL